MNETYLTVCGNVVADPIRRTSKAGVQFVAFRLASTSRRYDATSSAYVDGATNFVNVTAFRGLGANLADSLHKGDPVIVYGRMRVTQWSSGDRQGTSVDIDAYSAGHDLARGRSRFERVVSGERRTWSQPGPNAALGGDTGGPDDRSTTHGAGRSDGFGSSADPAAEVAVVYSVGERVG